MNLEIVVQTLSECGIPATNQGNYLKIGSTSLEVSAGIMKSRKFTRRFRNSKHFFFCLAIENVFSENIATATELDRFYNKKIREDGFLVPV